MFWNNECQQLSDQLWIPDKLIKQPDKKEYFRCDNNNISFSYYTNKDSFFPNIKFQDILAIDNSLKKEKLFSSLHKKEIKRFDKEIINPKCTLSHEELGEKHYGFMDKINDKINNLDGFIRSNKTQILPSTSQRGFQNWRYFIFAALTKMKHWLI